MKYLRKVLNYIGKVLHFLFLVALVLIMVFGMLFLYIKFTDGRYVLSPIGIEKTNIWETGIEDEKLYVATLKGKYYWCIKGVEGEETCEEINQELYDVLLAKGKEE